MGKDGASQGKDELSHAREPLIIEQVAKWDKLPACQTENGSDFGKLEAYLPPAMRCF